MPYILEICRAGKIIEKSKYYSPRWNCKGERRNKKSDPTIVCQEKVNLRLANKKLRRLMNHNFKDGDLLIGLDYCKELRPKDSVEMQEHIKKFLRELRKEYKKQSKVLKYIYVKEIGPKGAAHVHMMINLCDGITELLRKSWPYGRVQIDPLYTKGQYEDIASYFLKYADKTIKTEGKLIGKKYYPSRSLEKPKVVKYIVKNVDVFRETVKNEKGYELVKDSVLAGVTEAGFGYFSYYLHRTDNYDEEGEDG